MFINKDSLIINGISMGQYIVQVEYSYPKLWGEDTGRSLSGNYSGTLLGIFPKLIVQFRPLKQSELETLAPVLDSESQTISYYDPFKKAQTTISTYTGDWSVVNKSIGKNEGFSISFISRKKRV